MDHRARNVRRRAERRVPDDVQVCESRETERIAESSAAGALNREQKLYVAR